MNTMINEISPASKSNPADHKQSVSSGDEQNKFADVLKDQLANVNDAQKDADKATEKLANGEADDLHNVMASGQKASIALETSVQIQRKAIDAYNEVMQMQV